MKRFGMGYWLSAGLLAAFVLWTVLLGWVDVQAIGPRDSEVGFAALNGFVHNLTGVHFTLYHITDWLGLVPVAVGFGFAILGLTQWIGRKSLGKVDSDILLLGGFYLLTLGVYLLFEKVVINYRPVLIEGFLEVSYPSSTTLLVLCVMPTAMLQLNRRIRNAALRRWVLWGIGGFTAFMVLGRLVSGVHWVTDIVGGVLLSAAMVTLYATAQRGLESKDSEPLFFVDKTNTSWYDVLHKRRYCMDVQLKRGLLDVCVLAAIQNEDSYGYKIIKDMKPYITLSESTLYTILKRLEGANMLTVRTAEHGGRLRKYYRITAQGKQRIEEFKEEWQEIMSIYRFVTKEGQHE